MEGQRPSSYSYDDLLRCGRGELFVDDVPRRDATRGNSARTSCLTLRNTCLVRFSAGLEKRFLRLNPYASGHS